MRFLLANLLIMTFSFSSQAVELWQGERTIFSTQGSSERVYKVNLDANNTGILTTSDGQATMTYRLDGNVLVMSLQGQVQRTYTGYKFNEQLGAHEPVQVVDTLMSLNMPISEPIVLGITETWESCYELTQPTPQQVCDSAVIKDQGQLLISQSPKKMELKVLPGDRIVLPIAANDKVVGAYVQLNKDGSATVLDSGLMTSETAKLPSSWSLVDDELALKTTAGDTMSFYSIRGMEDSHRVLGSLKVDGKQKVVMGNLTVDQNLNFSASTLEQMSGDYRAVMASTNTTHDTTYTFGKDGIGGFTSWFSGEAYHSVWGWTWNNGVFAATQYMNELGMPMTEKTEVKACMDGTMVCEPRYSRQYKILRQDGNRYTMMRVMQSGSHVGVPFKTLSVWTLYKR